MIYKGMNSKSIFHHEIENVAVLVEQWYAHHSFYYLYYELYNPQGKKSTKFSKKTKFYSQIVAV